MIISLHFSSSSDEEERVESHVHNDNKSDDDDADINENSSQAIKQSRQSSTENVVSPLVQLFNVVTNTLLKSAAAAAQRSGAQLIGTEDRSSTSNAGSDESVDDNDNDNVTENVNGN